MTLSDNINKYAALSRSAAYFCYKKIIDTLIEIHCL